MKLETIHIIDEEFAKSLVGKHIHFTWHNKEDNTVEIMPGKVLEYSDKKLKIDTMDVIMLDDKEDSKMIKTFNIDDINDIFVFDKYKKECWTLLDNIELNRNYEITNVFGDKINAKIINYDSPLKITILDENNEYDYPLYFIEDIK